MYSCLSGGAASAGSCLPHAFLATVPVLAWVAGVGVATTAVLITTGCTVGAAVAVAGGTVGTVGAVGAGGAVGSAVGAAGAPAHAATRTSAEVPPIATNPRRLN